MKNSSKAGAFLIGNACMMLATIFWGVNVSVTKALIPDWMTAHGVTVVRLLGGCILFWLTSLFVKTQRIDPHDWKRIVLGGVVGLFGFIYLFVTSLKFGNPIDISIIMTLPPMFVVLIGVLFLKRRPSLKEYLGIGLSFAGAVIVILGAGGGGKAGSDNLLGDLLAIASTICYAFYLVIIEKPSHKYKPVTFLRWIFLFAAIPGCLLLFGFSGEPIFHHVVKAAEDVQAVAAPAFMSSHPIAWVEVAFVLFCPTFIAYFLVQPAMKDIGSELVSLYQYLLPVFATISAVLMGLDKLKWIQVVAMAVIVAGMVLTNLGKRKRVAKEAAKTSLHDEVVDRQPDHSGHEE